MLICIAVLYQEREVNARRDHFSKPGDSASKTGQIGCEGEE